MDHKYSTGALAMLLFIVLIGWTFSLETEDLTGNLNLAGNFTGNQMYGEMWFQSNIDFTTTIIGISGVYYNITGFNGTGADDSGNSLNGFKFDVDNEWLTTLVNGKYKVDYSISLSNIGNNQEYQIKVFVNQLGLNQTDSHRKVGAASDVGNDGSSAFIDLTLNDNVSLRIRNNDGVGNALIHAANINLWRVGNRTT